MNKLFKTRVITKFILNPFIWFSLVWSLVLLIHSFHISLAYPSLSPAMATFFLIIIFCSIVFAVIYHKLFLTKLDFSPIKNSKPSWPFIIFSYMVLVAEILYCKQVPIIATLRNEMMAYQEFGIPTISFLNTTFVFFIALLASIKAIYGDKKYIIPNLIIYALCLMRFVLLYSRGSLALCLLMIVLTFISKRKITLILVISTIIILIVGLVVFNALGNIRLGYAWNDSREFLRIAKVSKNYAFLKNVIWPLVYLDSPIGNLLYYESTASIEYSVGGLFSQLLPDFLSKRIFASYNYVLERPIYALNVSSMFAGCFKYFGYPGMFFSYAELVILIFVVSGICAKNNKYLIASSIGLTFISAMSFFDNMVTFSGYSFYLLYLVIACLIEKSDQRYVQKEEIKLLLQFMETNGGMSFLSSDE